MPEIPIEKIRKIHDLLKSHYGVYQSEIGDNEETEAILAELKNLLILHDKTFIVENSLYHRASQAGLGHPLLVATKNKKRIPLEELKKAFFPEVEGGFFTGGIGWNLFSVGNDKYAVIYGESFETAISRLEKMIAENEERQKHLEDRQRLKARYRESPEERTWREGYDFKFLQQENSQYRKVLDRLKKWREAESE